MVSSRYLNNITGRITLSCIVELYIRMVIYVEQAEFGLRISRLRLNKGVSARDMSLSIGQSPNYINGIENGAGFPSMSAFFYICDYLGVTPAEFFEIDSQSPVKEKELLDAVKGLSSEHLDHLIALAKALKK